MANNSDEALVREMISLLQKDVFSRDPLTVWRCVLVVIAQGCTPLHQAAACCWAPICADMIDHSADVAAVDKVSILSRIISTQSC